jgi:hypothetical protein
MRFADTASLGRPTVQPMVPPMSSTRPSVPAVAQPVTPAPAVATKAPSFTFAPTGPAGAAPAPAAPARPAPTPAAFAPATAPAVAATAQPAVAPVSGQAVAVAPARVPADAAAPGANWTRIELELRTSILNELAQSLPLEVDAIVRNKMGDAIERVVQQLAAETRLAIASSLREIVEHAVHSELERLRGRKR